jgi:hypothetical protein
MAEDQFKRAKQHPQYAGEFKNPRTGETVIVLHKKGESKADAMKRVRKTHGAL